MGNGNLLISSIDPHGLVVIATKTTIGQIDRIGNDRIQALPL
jgi:hypothetical protein